MSSEESDSSSTTSDDNEEEQFENEEEIELEEKTDSQTIPTTEEVLTEELYLALIAAIPEKYKVSCSEKFKLKSKGRMFYIGHLLNDKLHGYGELKWNNGDMYKGNFSLNRLSGEGKLTYNNGFVYNGQFEENKWHGNGTLTCPSWEYKGEFRNGYIHGNGTLTMVEYLKRFGEFIENTVKGVFEKNKLKSGYRVYENGIYFGSFDEFGYRSNGKFLFDNNDLYEGTWRNDQFCDFGVYQWNRNQQPKCKIGIFLKRPELYSGYWVDGKRHGVGRIEFKERHVFCEWVNGQRHGNGCIIAANGTIHVSKELYLRDIFHKAKIIARHSEAQIHLNEMMSITDGDEKNVCALRNEIFRDCVNELLGCDIFEGEYVLTYPIYIVNYILGWDKLPGFDKIIDHYNFESEERIFKIEIRSFNEVIKENYKTIKHIYKTYTIFQTHCHRTDLIMTRMGLWKLYEDIFKHIPSINKAKIISKCENDFKLFVDDPHDPFEKVFLWELICHLVTIVTTLNESPYVFHAAEKNRISFIGIFSQMFLIFLREFHYIELLSPGFFLQTMAVSPRKVKKFFKKVHLENDLTIRSVYRYMMSKKPCFSKLNRSDFAKICFKLYPNLKDPSRTLFINTTEKITPLEFYEFVFHLIEENIMKVKLIVYNAEYSRLVMIAKAQALKEAEEEAKRKKMEKKKPNKNKNLIL